MPGTRRSPGGGVAAPVAASTTRGFAPETSRRRPPGPVDVRPPSLGSAGDQDVVVRLDRQRPPATDLVTHPCSLRRGVAKGDRTAVSDGVPAWRGGRASGVGGSVCPMTDETRRPFGRVLTAMVTPFTAD